MGLLVISRGTALVLLFVYCAYIVFQVSSFLDYRRWPLITLIHVAENPCRTLYSRNPRERGGGRGRGGEDERCCGCLLVSHLELVLLGFLLPRTLLVYWLSLSSPHFVLIIASILSFFIFLFLEKSDDFMSFVFSGRLDRRICWTLFCSKTFYRFNFTPHSCK